MRSSVDFSRVVRTGVRVGGRRIVVHGLVYEMVPGDGPSVVREESDEARANAPMVVVTQELSSTADDPAPKVGFVVSRAVGNSVVRHRVARRLRAQTARRLSMLPGNSCVVVRALPAAAIASSAELGSDLARGFQRLVRTMPTRADAGTEVQS